MINRDNRDSGFSLVELVITILIMAIIAAALAPQVMKWVNNARISNDLQTRNTMESNARYATADPGAYEEIASRQIKITITEDGCMLTDTGSSDPFPKFVASLSSYIGKTISPDGNGYKISGIKLRTAGGEVNIFVTRGAVSSIINQVLTSDDLAVSVSDVVVPELWSSAQLTGSAIGGTLNFKPDGVSVINPAVALKREHHFDGTYLDDILVLEDAADITKVKLPANPPCWVYIGSKEAIGKKEYDGVVLYQWSGTRDEADNPIWKMLPINGLK